jgi:hypothetical protein
VANPKEIVALKKCGDLFSNDSIKAKDEYRRLAKLYHPDVSMIDGANEAFTRITELYNEAQQLFSTGRWEQSNYILLTDIKGNKHSVSFLKEDGFELGNQYICRDSVWYVFDKQNKRFYDNACTKLRSLKYKNSEMEKEISRFIPKIQNNFQSNDEKYVLQIQKSEDMFSLDDVNKHFSGSIFDRHVAWIISRLSNVCCFIDYCGLSHNGISIKNCFVSPKFHTVILVGGWWYCVNINSKMIGTQKQIYDVMPVKVKTDKIGSIITDLESVKMIGKELTKTQSISKDFKKWLDGGSSDSAQKEFAKWDAALDKSYGVRKFIKLDLSEQDIYK